MVDHFLPRQRHHTPCRHQGLNQLHRFGLLGQPDRPSGRQQRHLHRHRYGHPPHQPTNNRFFIVNEDILEGTLTIYNRHGLKVYSSSNPGVGWDGTHNGTPCPQGAYPWYFRYRTVIDPDRWHEVTGTVTLLR